MLGATHCAKHFFYHCHITATTLLRGTLIKRIKTNGSRTEGAPGAKHFFYHCHIHRNNSLKGHTN